MQQDNYSRRNCVRPFRPSRSFYSECDKEPMEGVRQRRNMVCSISMV